MTFQGSGSFVCIGIGVGWTIVTTVSAITPVSNSIDLV